MVRLCVNHWNNSFVSPKVRARIRQKVSGNLRIGRSVLLDFEGVAGLDRSNFAEIVAGWPVDKVRLLAPDKQAWLPQEHAIPVPPGKYGRGK